MTEKQALTTTYVTMLSLVVIAAFVLGAVGARTDLIMVVLMFIGFGGAFAISEVVAHYAKRDESERRRSHNPPASG
jgi:Sec-independent protein secretion pathway component TatC